MKKVAVINIVGLTKKKLNTSATPFLNNWLNKKKISTINPLLPAVTCSVQTTYLTGKWPTDHGIVGNGWFDKNYQEIKFWHQSNKLVNSPCIWDELKAKHPQFKCANMFWWFNMYSTIDFSVTPRPQYRTDGQKIPDCYSNPSNLRTKLQNELGQFPLFNFWGPKTSIKSSEWIAKASLKVQEWHDPNLLLIYLPHLDYAFQKFEENSKEQLNALNEIDNVCKNLISSLESKEYQVVALSEYGITPVNNPIHVNRELRRLGYIKTRNENELELLDAGASNAFAVCDHQIAHIYVKNKDHIPKIKSHFIKQTGISHAITKAEQNKFKINHSRAGDLVLISNKESWFTYYYWEDDKKAPDFARTVAIHNKPGYDPVELFFDPNKKLIYPRIALKLIKKKMGFRTLMDLIPLDASLVKGSHGQLQLLDNEKPIYIGSMNDSESLCPTDVFNIIKSELLNN